MSDDAEGGDAVCWLSRLCPECGAMPSEDDPDRCWRCGRTIPAPEVSPHPESRSDSRNA